MNGGERVTTMTAMEMSYRPGQLRHAVQDGQHVGLTFHTKTYGHVVPADWYERAAAALQREQAQAHEGVAA